MSEEENSIIPPICITREGLEELAKGAGPKWDGDVMYQRELTDYDIEVLDNICDIIYDNLSIMIRGYGWDTRESNPAQSLVNNIMKTLGFKTGVISGSERSAYYFKSLQKDINLDSEHSMYVEDGPNQWHQRMFISE